MSWRENAPVIIAARRCPVGTRGRALAGYDVADLCTPVISAVLADAAKAIGTPLEIADVLLGNCVGPGGNPARVAALQSGLGLEVPGGTVDRQCGSGLAAIIDAASAIRGGDRRARIAGGVESASTAPTRAIDGVEYDRARFTPIGFVDPDMTLAAETLAGRDGITRARQDRYAAQSHSRARVALAQGHFADELVPIGDLQADDAIGRAERLLSRLPPLFPDGTVTAGTSTRIGDGAAAVVVAPAGAGRALAIRATAIVGCDPSTPGVGAAPAVLRALDSLQLSVNDVAAFEIVEAFAAQALAVLSRLSISDDDPRVCSDGGALALGHPWGASGAISVVRLFSRLIRRGAPAGSLGVAAASVGGGLGVAMVLEVVE